VCSLLYFAILKHIYSFVNFLSIDGWILGTGIFIGRLWNQLAGLYHRVTSARAMTLIGDSSAASSIYIFYFIESCIFCTMGS